MVIVMEDGAWRLPGEPLPGELLGRRLVGELCLIGECGLAGECGIGLYRFEWGDEGRSGDLRDAWKEFVPRLARLPGVQHNKLFPKFFTRCRGVDFAVSSAVFTCCLGAVCGLVTTG